MLISVGAKLTTIDVKLPNNVVKPSELLIAVVKLLCCFLLVLNWHPHLWSCMMLWSCLATLWSCIPHLWSCQLSAHEHVTVYPWRRAWCAEAQAEGDRQKHGMQDIPTGAFETRNPAHPEGTPSGHGAAIGFPKSSWPPLGPWGFASLPNLNNDKERELRYKGRDR
jgi:hypothetical protein